MADSGAPAAKPKKSIFVRPTWAAQTTVPAVSTNTPVSKPETRKDLFSRAHNYNDLVQDRERQRRARESKTKAKEDRRRSSNTSDVTKHDEPRATKRRRTSDDEDVIETTGRESTETLKQRHSRPTSISPDDADHEFVPQKSLPRGTVIELDDDDDDDHDNSPAQTSNLPLTTTEPNPDDDLDDLYASEPEMLELVRKARAKRRQEEREQSEGGPDPIVKLLITSPIPGTVPLIVSRKLSQRLQEVREAWFSKQPFPPEAARSIFFTYKLRKVYDVTTCRSLGVRVDYLGRVLGDGPFTDLDEHAEKIHIEAVDDAWWQKLKDEKAAPKRNKYLDGAKSKRGEGEDSTEGTPALDDDSALQEPLIKVTLKARGHADIKIKVRPSTVFAKMVNAARSRFNLSPDRQVHLEFDGEKLEPPEGQVKDTDISDLDCIDVHIK